jgi:hypothetical protein
MRTCACAALMLTLVTMAFDRGQECLGAMIPETAYSRSLGMPPLLVEQPALVFVFPQVAPRWSSRAMGLGLFGNQDENSTGWGVLLGSKSPFSLLLDDGPDMGALLHLDRAVQVGWGTELGKARLGLSAGVGHDQQESGSDSWSPANQSESSQDVKTRGYFGNLGLGYEASRWFADVALQLASAKAENDRVQRTSSFTEDTLFEDRSRQELKVTPALTARLGWRDTKGHGLQAVGAWRELDVDTTNLLRSESASASILQSAEGSVTGELWEVGVSASTDRDDVGRATVFAHYQKRDEPVLRTLSSTLRTVSEKSETTTVGLSLERALVSRLGVLAGFRTAYVDRSQESRQESLEDGRFSVNTTSSSSVTDRFSWGLVYEHHQLQLVGALDSRLDLQDLVLTLDASFLF